MPKPKQFNSFDEMKVFIAEADSKGRYVIACGCLAISCKTKQEAKEHFRNAYRSWAQVKVEESPDSLTLETEFFHINPDFDFSLNVWVNTDRDLMIIGKDFTEQDLADTMSVFDHAKPIEFRKPKWTMN